MADRVIAVNEKAFTGDFTPIPTGTKLIVSVFDIEEGVSGPNSKVPGSPQFVYTAKVTEEGPFKGREIRYNYVPLDPNAGNAFTLVAFAEAVGWKTEKGVGVSVPEKLTDVLGTEFTAKIGQSQRNGNVYNTITGTSKAKPGEKVPEAPKKGWNEL